MSPRSRIATVASFLVSFCSMADAAHAGAWTLPEGESQLILNSSYYATDEAFDRTGRKHASSDFSKLELNPYATYGWDDRLTLGFSAFLHTLEQDAFANGRTEDNTGFGKTEVFAQYKLAEQDGAVLSVQPLIALPGFYSDGDGPRAADSHWEGQLGLLGGYGFDAFGQHHFVDGSVAYRHRFGELSDQFRLHAGLGAGVTESWQLLTELDATSAVDAPTSSPFSPAGRNDYDLLRGQVSVIYALDDSRKVQLGAFRHLDGENTGAGGGALLSFWTVW